MLSDAECRVLALYCWDHPVASCDECRRNYKVTELGVDMIGHRYYFCPSCRLELVDDLRLHILGCPTIATSLHERLERGRELKKGSDLLIQSSAVLAAESEARAKRVLDAMRQARRGQD